MKDISMTDVALSLLLFVISFLIGNFWKGQTHLIISQEGNRTRIYVESK